jgi:hypothetical protein
MPEEEEGSRHYQYKATRNNARKKFQRKIIDNQLPYKSEDCLTGTRFNTSAKERERGLTPCQQIMQQL